MIVTGAATGIGLAIARHFLDKGANLMCADIDEVRLENECGEAARAEGALHCFGGDLRERLTIARDAPGRMRRMPLVCEGRKECVFEQRRCRMPKARGDVCVGIRQC